MKKLSPKYLIMPVILLAIGVVAFMQLSNHQAKAENENAATPTGAQDIMNVENAWQVRCNEAEEGQEAKTGKGNCEVVQRLSIQETGQRLIELAIGYPDDKENARGVFILPTGVLLEPGIAMSIDDNEPMSFKVRYCLPNGCFAFLNLNEDVLATLRKGKVINVDMMQMNGQKLRVPMPLNGFSKALDQVG